MVRAVVSIQPQVLALDIDAELTLGTYGLDQELVLVLAGADVVGGPEHRPYRPVVVAQHDGVVELDRRVERAGHHGERSVDPLVEQPQAHSQGVRQLRLGVATAAQRRVGPGRLLGHRVGVRLRIGAGVRQQFAGRRRHVDRHGLDPTDAHFGHQPLGFAQHRHEVPAEGDGHVAPEPLRGGDEVPGLLRVGGDRLLDEHVSSRLHRRQGVLAVEARRAGDEDDIEIVGHDVAVVLAGELEAERVLDSL